MTLCWYWYYILFTLAVFPAVLPPYTRDYFVYYYPDHDDHNAAPHGAYPVWARSIKVVATVLQYLSDYAVAQR